VLKLPEESATALVEGDETSQFLDMRRASPFLGHEDAGILAQVCHRSFIKACPPLYVLLTWIDPLFS
jgi:hypothetical protein